MKASLWVNDNGQIMKSQTDLLGGMYTYRTTEAGATAAARGQADIMKIIRTRPIPDPEKSAGITYRISGPDVDGLFPDDHRQSARPEAAGQVLLNVDVDSPNTGAPGPADPGAEYLRATPLVDSEDSKVVSRMREAIGNRVDPWARAVAIEEWVFQNIRKKNFSTAFAPAAEVARNLSGDCTEHSVLVAAMARAAGIPSRCAVGLVYVPDLNGFGPHMWNEVYINNRWVALDASFNQSHVDPTHLKVSTASLDGPAAFEAFLPVLRLLGKLEIDPIEVR